MHPWIAALLLVCTLASARANPAAPALPMAEQIDAEVGRQMAASGVRGLALALIDGGQVRHVQAFGQRNAQGQPLLTDTVMYGASLTKAVFAYTVVQLVDEGRVELDRSVARDLPQPLPEMPPDARYAKWSDLAGDERWRLLTPRILLSHRAGFANFAFLEPDGRLRIHFQPGSHYAYSGEGYILLQYVLEQGLGLDVGQEMQRRVFDRLGMGRTSMTWRADFADNVAEGFAQDGSVRPHDRRSRVRAAGSMDTSIADFARFAAAFVRGDGLSAAGRAELSRPQAAIGSRRQFPTLEVTEQAGPAWPGLATGLGVISFQGPQGPGFFKGGHNDSTGNTWVCLERSQRCLVLLSNDVRAEAIFPSLVEFTLGQTGLPWGWEYGP